MSTSEPLTSPGQGLGFGTAPVFLASISTILGAVLFLRFGYSVAHAGVMGSFLIVILGHLVTVPTALAIAEIATNRRVEGGGEYFIISRSFGSTIGGAIGIALYFSQAISVAFYMIAFAEAFRPLSAWFEGLLGQPFDPRWISIPATFGLAVVVIIKGADLGIKALWVVVSILAVSLLLFFLGEPLGSSGAGIGLFDRVADPDSFMLVFAIVFPAFTGMTAGVGLSGDLKNPRRSIPLGILSATGFGMLVYFVVILKLAQCATPDQLAGDQLVMGQIALWGPIIPIGLACATVSSAIGSILVAPRTLQALASDRNLPLPGPLVSLMARGEGEAREPRNATILTALLALVTVSTGNVDFVARIISMFFMVTYGALCAISFLEHFAARPSYRPSFRSKWYLSLLGAVSCLLLMFQMDPLYALLALVSMVGLYRLLAVDKEHQDDLGVIAQGVMTQATRSLQVHLQEGPSGDRGDLWRPSIIMVDSRTFDRSSPLQFLGWLCHRYAVGTYLHFIPGRLDRATFAESRRVLPKLVELTRTRRSRLFVDTMISPSMKTALAQSLQVPGVAGVENNTALFELSTHDGPEVDEEVLEGCRMVGVTRMDLLVLRHGNQFFGSRRSLHLWLTWDDYENLNLMVLLAYILIGHRDWSQAEIQVFAAFPREEAAEQRERLSKMASEGRVPISPRNLRIIPTNDKVDYDKLVARHSAQADLMIRGFDHDKLERHGSAFFRRHEAVGDVLFVSARRQIEMT